MLYGMMDIGSSTIRLAIYQLQGSKMEMLMKKKHTVGLAAYVKDGVLSQAGIDLAAEILGGFKKLLAALSIEHFTATATAALRNAVNGPEAVKEIERRTGLLIEVIDEAAEAEYDFTGAVHNLTETKGLLADIGGGSTELVHFADGKIEQKASLHLGALGYHTLYVRGLLPTAAECAAMREAAAVAIRCAEDFAAVKEKSVCGIGGTFKGALALYNAIFRKEADNKIMRSARLGEIIRRFQSEGTVPPDNAILLLKHVPDRLHTVLPGLIIADEIAKYFQGETIVYSNSGMREGYIYKRVLGGESA